MTPDAAERIIVALDCNLEQARCLTALLRGRAAWLKVGMTLYYAVGPEIVREFKGQGFKVFVDLKLHDIPHQVCGAARSLTLAGADMLTVHASGGTVMLQAAVAGVQEGLRDLQAAGVPAAKPMTLGITVLTSMDQETLTKVGIDQDVVTQVQRLAGLTRSAGLDGVVASPQEAAALRQALGSDAVIVTPGVRLADANADDQSRVATPVEALSAGASYLVIGRPITAAADPLLAFNQIVRSIEA
jgi:orotidine-5'-phosphate decarboxylase